MEAQKHNNKKKNPTPEGKFRHDIELCTKRKDLTTAMSLYDSALSNQIRLNHYLFNALLYICSESLADNPKQSAAAAIEFGFRVFNNMLSNEVKPTEATITAMARLAGAKGDGDVAFELVKSMEKYSALPRLRSYNPVLLCYCRNLDADKAYEVESHMALNGVVLEEPEIAALLKVSAESVRVEKVYEYLHKMREKVRGVSESTAEIIESWFGGEVAAELSDEGDYGRVREAVLANGGGWHGLGWLGKGKWIVKRTSVDGIGVCLCCGEQLACVDIDTAETEKFLQSVAALAMEREVQSNFKDFQDWLEKHAGYEAIVDGANIGLYQQNFTEGGFSLAQLEAVVNELQKLSNKWPLVVLHNKRVRSLQQNASDQKLIEKWITEGVLYGTPYGSNDDWYWLYAAIKLKCLMVTNDEMRDHIFELLGTGFFLKWKERHQARYTFTKGHLKLQMPPAYSLVIQESEKGTWHVPISAENTEESSRNWLCITRQHCHIASNGDVAIQDVYENGHCSDIPQICDKKDSVVTGKRKERPS